MTEASNTAVMQRADEPADAGPAPAAPVLTGALVRMDGAKAIGWARDTARPDQPIDLELVIDGEVVDRTLANEAAPSPEDDLGAGAGKPEPPADPCWFTLKTPVQFRTGRELTLRVRAAGTEQYLEPALRTKLFGGLKSKLVDVHNGVARGWVSNPFAPDQTPELELFVDGVLEARLKADLKASDPLRLRFETPLPSDLQDGENHRVAVFWAGTRIEIPGSPIAWKAPEPRAGRGARIHDRLQQRMADARPPYALLRAETVAPQNLLARRALAERLPAAVAEQQERLARLLSAPPAGAGPTVRLSLFLAATSLDDLDVSFGLTQLLEQPGLSVQPYLVLASEETVRFAREHARASGLDQLVQLIPSDEIRTVLKRFPEDDVMAFLPARTVVLPAMLAAIEAVAAGRADAVGSACGAVGVAGDGLIWASPEADAPGANRLLDIWDAALVCRKTALADRLEVRRTPFEGVLMDELGLRVDAAEPLAARLDLARRPPAAPQAATGRPALVLLPVSGADDPVLGKAKATAERCGKYGARLAVVAPLGSTGEAPEGVDVVFDVPSERARPDHWRALAELVCPGGAALVLLQSPSKASARAEFFGAVSFAPKGAPSQLSMRPEELPATASLDDLLGRVSEAAGQQDATMRVLHLPGA